MRAGVNWFTLAYPVSFGNQTQVECAVPGPKSPLAISGRKLRIFQRGAGRGWDGEMGGERAGVTGSLWPTQCRLETQVFFM